jgi:hypothetical protein
MRRAPQRGTQNPRCPAPGHRAPENVAASAMAMAARWLTGAKIAALKTAVLKANYALWLAVFYPLNLVLTRLRQQDFVPASALHVSYMVHIPWHTTRILRRHGWKADYLAVGSSPHWDKADYYKPAGWSFGLALKEFMLFWQVMAKYEVVHFHFMITMSVTGWEIPILKRLGRTVVAHFRGCEARNRELNMRLHPDINICQECDYNAAICTSRTNARRRRMAERWADLVLVTTPDMLDFMPQAIVFPFFAPTSLPERRRTRAEDGPLRVLHVTNHPGIEGTAAIQRAIENLRARGHRVEFVYLKDVPHESVLAAMQDADLAVGKMKMGFYANAQIESMASGIPTVTWIRPQFMTEELRRSGFIICHLNELERTLEHYLTHPQELEQKRRLARESILKLHDNDALARRLIDLYAKAKAKAA